MIRDVFDFIEGFVTASTASREDLELRVKSCLFLKEGDEQGLRGTYTQDVLDDMSKQSLGEFANTLGNFWPD